jgi:hypothetical protein
MTESDWQLLLRQIRDGYVVPVLGWQLMADSDGGLNVQREAACRLLGRHEIPNASWPTLPLFRELNAAVSHLIGLGKNTQHLYADVSAIFEAISSDPAMLPKPVRQLAEITDFRLFVTMTCDTLLATALRKSRVVREIVHAPKVPSDEWEDLPTDWKSRHGNEASVLYLFGKARASPTYAIHDEDVLEYAHNVMARGSNVPVNYLKALQERSLLILGCGLPDWLGRFFLRLTNKDRLSEKKRHEWLVEAPRPLHPDDEWTSFLKRFSGDTEYLQLQPPSLFIDELHSRWLNERARANGSGATESNSKRQEVPYGVIFFVSYSRGTDGVRAQRLVDALRQLGCAESEVWFDVHAVEPGREFAKQIAGGIASCHYFLPLYSEATVTREEAYVFEEWRTAEERARRFNRRFIVPLVVDEAYKPERYKNDVVPWDKLDYGHAPDGIPNERTLALLKQLVRDARKAGRA